MSKSARAKIVDAPEYGLKWGDKVEWTYSHALGGGSRTMRTLVGTFTGLSHHTRRHWQKYMAKQMAFVHFEGNKNNSRVPVSELKKI